MVLVLQGWLLHMFQQLIDGVYVRLDQLKPRISSWGVAELVSLPALLHPCLSSLSSSMWQPEWGGQAVGIVLKINYLLSFSFVIAK